MSRPVDSVKRLLFVSSWLVAGLAALTQAHAAPISLKDQVFWIIPGDEVHDCNSGLVVFFPLDKPFHNFVAQNTDTCDPSFPVTCDATFEVEQVGVAAEMYQITDLAALDTNHDGEISTEECQAASDDLVMLVPATHIASGTVRYELHGRMSLEGPNFFMRYSENISGWMTDLATGALNPVTGVDAGTVTATFNPLTITHAGTAQLINYPR